MVLSWLFLSLFLSAGVEARVGTPHYRDYFYVGQSYFPSGNSTIAAEQIYVEHLSPASGQTQKYPLLFVHGAGMTASNFLNTPDGRQGWADWFMAQGYDIYLVDQPSRGRSPWHAGIDGPQASTNAYAVESLFTATRNHKLWPNASLHTQWPGNGSVGDPIFDKFFASMVPLLTNAVETSTKVQNALVALLDIIGPVIVVVHSQAGLFCWPLADARPNLVKAIVALEPGGPPFIGDPIFSPNTPDRPWGLTEIPMTYAPPITNASQLQKMNVSSDDGYTCIQQVPPARQWPNLRHIPVLTVTSETSWHGIFDGCIVRYLRDAGVSVDFVRLQDAGIHGNGHMFFMEKNNLDIAERVVQPWLKNVLHDTIDLETDPRMRLINGQYMLALDPLG